MKHSNKSLILRLLVSDMKHEQLVAGLHRLGFESDVHGSSLCDVVAELMNIPRSAAREQWIDRYMAFLEEAAQLEISGNGNNLLALAERCYEGLKE